ncbi:hypothetical protein V8C42DRAFT_317586 [Trichoderma barbatum]
MGLRILIVQCIYCLHSCLCRLVMGAATCRDDGLGRISFGPVRLRSTAHNGAVGSRPMSATDGSHFSKRPQEEQKRAATDTASKTHPHTGSTLCLCPTLPPLAHSELVKATLEQHTEATGWAWYKVARLRNEASLVSITTTN